MTAHSLPPIAHEMAFQATRLPVPEQVPALRRVLACLGLVDYGDVFEPLPTTCGHPSSLLVRSVEYTGTRCSLCAQHRQARKNAARRAVTA